MHRHNVLVSAAAGMALAAIASSASAQKSADRVRLALTDPIQTTLLYDDQKPEMELYSPAIYDTLLCYDRKKRQFVPLLATSWKQVDPKTLEFTLRSDVKFHDGSPFGADDVVYTLNWVSNPDSKLRFAPNENNLGWIDHAEKVDALTVRVIAKKPTPIATIRVAVFAPIVSSKLHSALDTKSDYGRKTPVGTGPYRVASFDATKGVELVRNDDYRHGSDCKPAASIGKAQISTIPEVQTQLAQLMVGGIDVARISRKDEAEAMAQHPDIRITAVPDALLHTIQFDAMNKSGNAALANPKVRRAIAMGVDREFVARSVMPGGEAIKRVDAMCAPVEIACDFSEPPPKYDVAAAKALLAEAGYPDGFDTEITVIPTSYPIGEALAGELRKIGVRAKVDRATFVAFRQKQADNKLQMLVSGLPIQSALDASTGSSYYFDNGPRNYTGDALLTQLHQQGLAEIDPAKRKPLYRQMYGRVNEMTYLLPLVTTPDVFVHTKDMKVDSEPPHPEGVAIYDMSWN